MTNYCSGLIPYDSDSNSLSSYLREIKKFPIMSSSEESNLVQRWCEFSDTTAAQQLVTSHLRFVVKIATKFKGYGIPVMDLISEGNIGLMHAVKKFNPKFNCRLSTYAIWWIKANIQDYILKTWSIVRSGSSALQKKIFFNVRKMREKISKIHHGLTLDQQDTMIAKELGASSSDVKTLGARLVTGDLSLDSSAHGDDDDRTVASTMVEMSEPSHELAIIENRDLNSQKTLLYNAMSKLSDREQDIIKRRKLLDSPDTLEVLSTKYNVSKERVRQIEGIAMKKLSSYIAEHQSAGNSN